MKHSLAHAAVVGTAILLLTTSCGRRGKKEKVVVVDFASAVSALTNLAHFARTPLGTPRMASSYDRTGGNQDWDEMPVRDKDGLRSIATLEGPGCVKRIWQTNTDAEQWFFFFDGEQEARLVLTQDELFGGAAPFEPPLADNVSGGYFSYVPMPFGKSLRIAVSFREGLTSGFKSFYHVNYETYDDSVRVLSFPKRLSSAELQLVQRARESWDAAGPDAERAKTLCGPVKSEVVAPGASVTWLDHAGAGVLRTFWFRWSDPPGESDWLRARLLRQLVLRIHWDGAATPSVDVPLGDFFCNGLHRRRFVSLPVAVLDDAMVCRFPMPFRKSARAELRNDSSSPVTVEWGYSVQPQAAATGDDLNYFHARWNSSENRGGPFAVLATQGRGHYVGCYLVAIGTDGTWNILESDESMFLDGEAMPSVHGTGLEDYFNGAWYYSGIFDRQVHGLVEKAAMRTAQYRFHLSDAVAFRNRYFMNFEFGHGNASRGYLSGVAYWYQSEPVSSGTVMPPAPNRYPPPDKLEPASIMAGVFELEAIGLHEEAAERCRLFAEKYRGGEFATLLMLRSAANRELAEGIASARGTYEAIAREAPDSDAGRQAGDLLWFHQSPSNALLAVHADMRVKFYVDGQPAAEGADHRAVAPLVSRVVLGPGEHEITAEVTPIGPSPWVGFRLRTQTANVVSDETSECTLTRPSDWPHTRDTAATWNRVEYAKGGLPKMAWWQFMPNGYAGMQGGQSLIEPAWNGWEKQPYVTTYLRKRFVVPGPNSDSVPQ